MWTRATGQGINTCKLTYSYCCVFACIADVHNSEKKFLQLLRNSNTANWNCHLAWIWTLFLKQLAEKQTKFRNKFVGKNRIRDRLMWDNEKTPYTPEAEFMYINNDMHRTHRTNKFYHINRFYRKKTTSQLRLLTCLRN